MATTLLKSVTSEFSDEPSSTICDSVLSYIDDVLMLILNEYDVPKPSPELCCFDNRGNSKFNEELSDFKSIGESKK